MAFRQSASILLLAASTAVVAQDQGPRPSFKTGVQLVRIDVSVLDGKRQPVRDLQAADFTVLEDGQPRPIRAFEAVDHAAAPSSRQDDARLPAYDIATNRASDDTSRLIFILMDRSIPPERPMLIARQIADAAVDAMAPGDVAAIVTTGLGVPQNLTSDRARLHKTIAAGDWSQGLSQAQKDDPIVARMGLADVLSDPRCTCGLCVMDTIARIANDVRDVPRRKVLLFIGSNLIVQAGPRAPSADVGCDKRVQDSRERLFEALGTSGLTVHSIDPQGLANVGPATRATVPNGIENRDARVLNGQLTQETVEFMAAQGNLGVLPELTGGRTVLNSNEPFRMVPEVLHESDAYYLLAFDPIERTGDVRHTIEVKVARKGVDVHTARYIPPSAAAAPSAASTSPPSPLERALTDVLPDASLPLQMSVASFAGANRGQAYVGITLNASAFATAPGAIPLEIAVLASDERGRRVGGARQTGTVQVPAAAGGLSPFVELQTYLTLPAGDYDLRAAVMNPVTHVVSSVFTHVTVPAFDDGRLTLSDIVLATQQNAGALPDAAPAIPVVPTTARALASTAPAWAFLRAYRGDDKIDVPPVGIETSVFDDNGKRVRHQALPAAVFVGRNADLRLALPLKDLPSGRYLLRIDASQGHAGASRSIAFAVTQPVAATAPEEHSPDLDVALKAAAAYLEQYEQRISAIGAEEDYEQAAQAPGGSVVSGNSIGYRPQPPRPAAPATRKTRANLMTISLGARGWVSFRDVFELDGKPVRDRQERLSRILQNVTPDSLEQAQRIAAESARYNLDADTLHVNRTINVPMTALLYLRAANQPRSSFRLGRPERIGGAMCAVLQFTERTVPRLMRTNDDAPAQGTFWIDMAAGGRVVRSELRVDSAASAGQVVRSQTRVTYARVDKLDLWLPAIMDESYVLPAGAQLTGHATYSDFHEFKVTTSADIK